MDRRRLKVMLGLGAVLIMGTAGVYADLKPYQRERIRIAFHDAIHPGDATHVVRRGQGEMAVDAEESR